MDAMVDDRVMFRQESLSDFREECEQIIEAHYQEIALDKNAQKLDPDWEEYERLEKLGRFWLMTARHRGMLVGYIVMLITKHLHYKSLVMAVEDIHYLSPEYRRGLLGYKLLAIADREMKKLGVKKCVFRTKFFKNHGKLFERLGYKPEDEVWGKVF
ncbi:MAG TPA: GNAT family N-acetyltransferase [Nitrospiria bacterium]|jgi:hypothetical protein|nr:GNAT family N-acetyltransferase [Nitrospiria bacterium]